MAASGWDGMNNWQKGAAGIAGGAAIAPFFSDKPNFNNPASAAMPYLDKIPEAMRPYYQPYIDRGNRAGNQLEGQYGEMTGNPGGLYDRLGAGYKESPGYQFKLHQALMAGDNAAAAGGMAGSNQHQFQNQETAEGLASQDYNDYMSKILGLYNGGISGEQDFNKQGFGASTDYGTSIANALASEGKYAAYGTDQRNQYNQARAKSDADMWGNLAGFAGTAAGFAFGGPPGAAAGGAAGKAIGDG